ncbi:type IX secretion system membrane protein, PorP/SprF family [Ekhidna lutea]|uniref:Type IX secretion system membrane protein, PorP/SprF family n=1 Tax=Ekhidna lutea TaxID=447679 RepID=A0A239L5I7_EKHLU|nr:PorP/SprF family type IX secretion system membrane protein [Ekhidna lutea]SNT24949.1 type IX secretion system membrane protein, PorP/SprF family [Ekhidna lutea]
MRRNYIVIAFLLIGSFSFGQEGQFSQYFASSSILNPAFTGTIPNLSFNTNYKRGGDKSQESFLELMQVTFTYPFKKTTSKDFQTGGAGITFFQEKRGFQGIYNSKKVLLTGAYAMRLSRLKNESIIFGLQGGIVEHRIDGSSLTWGSQWNKYIGHDNALTGEEVGSNPIVYPTFNFGVIYTIYDNENRYVRDRSLIVGLSADNLNRPKVSFDGFEGARKSLLLKGFVSSKLPLTARWYMHPSAYVLYSQGNTQINGGLYVSTFINSAKSKTAVQLQLGSWYRLEDSIIVLAGFEIENLKIGFSFDLNTQSFDINQELGGNLPTYEVSLTYNLDLTSPLRNISSPIF